MPSPARTLARAALAAALASPLAGCAPVPVETAESAYQPVEGVWAPLPDGREWGATSAVFPAPDGMSIWVGERCGANTCADSEADPILQFDLDGQLLASFGAGLILWPHGIFVDDEGSVWMTDAVGFGQQPEGWGHIVVKFSREGEVLMVLGEKGVPGEDETHFRMPSDVLVSPDGSIFVADGHNAGGNNRIVKLDAEGNFLAAWGSTGAENGELRDPHALAMDSQGRLFVGDRGNSRIQIFDQDGAHLHTWTQFGRPSGLYIDENDVLYATDSESNTARNPGWRRGVYIGSAATGWVTDFIADPVEDQDGSATSGGEGVATDAEGSVYTAEVGPRMLRKFTVR